VTGVNTSKRKKWQGYGALPFGSLRGMAPLCNNNSLCHEQEQGNKNNPARRKK